MMEITGKQNKMWSRLGSRAVYGLAILQLAEYKDNLIVLSADLGNSSGLSRFKNSYPEKFLNIGIAEQNMVGIAAGLAKEGFTVFFSSFAPFVTMRAAEQVRMNMGYMNLNIKAVSIGSGVSMNFLGNSHYGLEDAAVMRSIPNITIICPADPAEIFKAVFASAESEKPIYIRLTGEVGFPAIYKEDYEFQIGKAIQLCSGDDLTIIATGAMVYEALAAHEILKTNGLFAEVINMHTIKPIDEEAIHSVVKKSKPIFTIEEHSIIGGLGSAIVEITSKIKDSPQVIRLGLPDDFIVTAEYQYLLKKYELKGEQIANKIKEYLNT